MSWFHEEESINRAGFSADIWKELQGNHFTYEGFLEEDPPENFEALLAREAIQNSWDSAIERNRQSPRMHLHFNFKNFSGNKKSDFLTALDSKNLQKNIKNTEAQRSSDREALKKIRDDLNSWDENSLKILTIHEKGTNGMHGNWKEFQSRMYLALVSFNRTQKEEGVAGGTYGHGKAALSLVSNARIVIAYSCFKEREEELGITRRLLGVSYWPGYESSEKKFTGWGRFGESNEPFINEEADKYAEAFGIGKRNANDEEDFGTTFIIISPTVEAEELAKAIEYSWWPAIVDKDGFSISITNFDGDEVEINPEGRPALEAFIKGYKIAQGKIEPESLGESLTNIGTPEMRSMGKRRFEAGKLGLTSDKDGWSRPDEGDHKSLIALIRGPRMVVTYWGKNQRPPFVRGTFLANTKPFDPKNPKLNNADFYLSKTEPVDHSTWGDNDNDANTSDKSIGVSLVKEIFKELTTGIQKLRREIEPPKPPERSKGVLPEFDDIMKKIMGGGKKAPGKRKKGVVSVEPRRISINTKQGEPEVAPNSDEKIISKGTVTFGLTQKVEDHEIPIKTKVTIDLGVLRADTNTGSSSTEKNSVPIKIIAPSEWEKVADEPATYEGRVDRESVDNTFEWVSDPYDKDWIVEIGPKATEVDRP